MAVNTKACTSESLFLSKNMVFGNETFVFEGGADLSCGVTMVVLWGIANGPFVSGLILALRYIWFYIYLCLYHWRSRTGQITNSMVRPLLYQVQVTSESVCSTTG